MRWGCYGWTDSQCVGCTDIQQRNQRHDVTSISYLKLNICLRSPDTQRLCIRNIYWEFKLWVISYIFHSNQGNSRENRLAKEQFSSLARRGRKNCSGKILMGSQTKNLVNEIAALISCTFAVKPWFAAESAAENKWVNSSSLTVETEQVAFKTNLLGGKAK